MTFFSDIKETMMGRKKKTETMTDAVGEEAPVVVADAKPTPKPKSARTKKAVSRLEQKYRRKAHA